MHVVRRGHLFAGLFLLPWVLLYGVTAFLFNHPSAFPDQPTVSFGRPEVAGTPLEAVPSALETASAVVAELNRRGAACTLVRPDTAAFGREFAFATVKADGQTVSVLVDAATGTGTLRSKLDDPPKPPAEPAPFAVGPKSRADGPSKRGRGEGPGKPLDDGVRVENPLHERLAAALPAVLERCGLPAGEVTVTSSPDVVFQVEAGGREWQATYSPMTGAVAGRPADAAAPAELSARRFLLRLHTAHGYPGQTNARWWWAVIVDAMAFVMVFWAVSGFLMWWQIKATRRLGVAALALSAVAATWLGVSMYRLLTG
jgi:hypothetical protein